ncbi:uncharacterized protein ACMZJ9_001143 [Mantella aurantiaca]
MNSCVNNYNNDTILSSPASRIPGAIFLGLAATLGLPGNTFIIWSILWKMKGREKSVTCILILNLALADGAVLLLTPFFIIFLAKKSWIFGRPVCKIAYYLCCLNMYASIFIIALMSMDRFLAVFRPYLAQSLRKRDVVVKVLIVIWLLAGALALPAFAFREVIDNKVMNVTICEPCHASRAEAIFHYSFETLVAFLLPFPVVCFSYMLVLMKLKSSRFGQRSRIEKLIAVILLTFAILWLPYHVVNAMQVTANLTTGNISETLAKAAKKSRAGATALAFFSACVNPLLYAFAASDLFRVFGVGFVAKLLEGTVAEIQKRVKSQRDLVKGLVRVGSRGESVELQVKNGVKLEPLNGDYEWHPHSSVNYSIMSEEYMVPSELTTSNSSFTNSTVYPMMPHGYSHKLGIAILSVAFIIGFPGNAFVIWSILSCMKKCSVTCLLILHLAIADIIVILTAPMFLHLLSTGSWIFGNIICKICHYISCLSMYASIILITSMSIDRYFAVARPLSSATVRTKMIFGKVLLAIWVSACMLAIPMPIYRAVETINNKEQCRHIHSSPSHIIFHYVFETVTGFVIPFTIVMFCYLYIGLRLRSAKFQTKYKTSRLVVMIMVVFALFWLPYHVVNIIEVSGEVFSSDNLRKAARLARPNVTALAFLSSSINPILYVFAGGSFIRTAGVEFMAKLFEGTGSDTNGVWKISQVFRHKSHEESMDLGNTNIKIKR